MNLSRTLLALAAAALPAFAQSPFEVNASAILASGDMNKMVQVNNLAGYSVGGAFRIEIKPGLDHRFHLDLMAIRGKMGTGLKGSGPKHLDFGYDVVYQGTEKLSVFGGLMAVKWKIDGADATLPDYTDLNARNNQGKGTKLGARLGVEYAYTKNWKGVLSYTQTEFNKKLQPGWWSAGMTYRF